MPLLQCCLAWRARADYIDHIVLSVSHFPPSQVSPSGTSNPSDLYGDAILDEWGTYQPTLGPTWHHCVSTRLTMRLVQQPQWAAGSSAESVSGDSAGAALRAPVRCLSITKSPVAGPSELHVVIAAKGIVEHTA